MDSTRVAVWMVTYNHERYIAQAIESVIAQKTSFKYELFIGEDCSTDATRAVCQNYVDKYPDIIKLIPTEKNSILQNCLNVFEACYKSGAQYVAMLEGDDFWVDEYKLQRQVDFLDAHPDYTITCTDIIVVDSNNNELPGEKYKPQFSKDEFTIEDMIMSSMNIIFTPTIVYRNVLPIEMPEFYKTAKIGDMAIQLLLGDKGKAKFLPQKSSAYRDHSGGITKSGAHQKHEVLLKALYEKADVYFNYKYHKLFKKRFLQIAKRDLIYGSKQLKGLERQKHIIKKLKEYFKYSEDLRIKELGYFLYVLYFKRQE